MHSLRELQLAFLDAVCAAAPERVLPLLRAPDGAPAEAAARAGLGVYADAVVATARHALELGFPVVAALGGTEWFAGCAGEYVRTEHPRSGDLHWLGERFPAFLAQHLAGGPYAYFADVARLERAYQEVIVAADAPPLDLAALASVPPARHGALVFVPHPAARVVSSGWPILDVWRAHRPDAPPDAHARVDLGSGPQHVLVMRRTDHVELSALTAEAAALHGALAAGRPLDAAVDALGTDFPLASALTDLATRGALGDFVLHGR